MVRCGQLTPLVEVARFSFVDGNLSDFPGGRLTQVSQVQSGFQLPQRRYEL
jgi:hypothetical protein